MNVLTSILGADYLRSVALGVYGRANFEEAFLLFKKRLEEDTRSQAKLLESQNQAIVGYVSVQPDRRWEGDTYLLDLFLHPNFRDTAKRLLEALNLPEDKIQCYADSRAQWKARMLQKAGFVQEATFKGQLSDRGERLDVTIYGRMP